MTQKQLIQFVEYLLKKNIVIAPQYDIEDNLHLAELKNSNDIYIGTELPLDSWKFFMLPPDQVMFEYQGDEMKEVLPKGKNQVLCGVSILDMQALTLLNQVYEKDPYYQSIKKKTIIIGTSLVPEGNLNKFFDTFEENKLEHLQFDIFLAVQKTGYKIFTGSEDGQRLLDKYGYKNYQHIEYAGPIREEGLDQPMLDVKDSMQNYHNQKIWDDLGKRCIQCGKCTIACPVCFCFRMYDQAGLQKDTGQRGRCWDSCFYNEFTQVAGANPESSKHRFLNKTAEKIYFWYEHHFVRTPTSYSVPGCVGCGRCTRTCPADIDINETIKEILK